MKTERNSSKLKVLAFLPKTLENQNKRINILNAEITDKCRTVLRDLRHMRKETKIIEIQETERQDVIQFSANMLNYEKS